MSVYFLERPDTSVKPGRSAPRGRTGATGPTFPSIGLATGLLPALGPMRVLGATIVGVDSASLALWSMPLVLGGAVALAIYIPSRRATRVDPMLALRDE